jgi:hypothetical protein
VVVLLNHWVVLWRVAPIAIRVAPLSGSEGSVAIRIRSTAVFVRGVRDLIHVAHGGRVAPIVIGVAPLSGSEGSVAIRIGSTAVFIRGVPGSRGLIGCWKLCVMILHDDLYSLGREIS